MGCREGPSDLAADVAAHQEIMTNIINDMSPTWAAEVKKYPADQWKTADQGCATTLVAASDPRVPGKW